MERVRSSKDASIHIKSVTTFRRWILLIVAILSVYRAYSITNIYYVTVYIYDEICLADDIVYCFVCWLSKLIART